LERFSDIRGQSQSQKQKNEYREENEEWVNSNYNFTTNSVTPEIQ
jgi:hypothetical protein